MGAITTGAHDIESLTGDFDADGVPDQFTTYGDAGDYYWARIDLSYGFATQIPISTTSGVLSTHVVNFDAPGDIGISLVLTSPSNRQATFYTLYGCGIDVIMLDGGGVAEFPIRWGGIEMEGVTCNSDGITVTHATEIGGGQWEVSGLSYLWVPGLGELQGTMGAAGIFTSPADDDVINDAGAFFC